MKKPLITLSYFCFLCLALTATLTTTSCKKENFNVGVTVSEKLDNKTWEDLSAQWWTSFYSYPAAKNPAFDKTGALQPVSSSVGNTVFLFGSGGDTLKRTITIKEGQYIFAPMINFTSWYIKGDTCDPTFVPAKGQSDLDFLKSTVPNDALSSPVVLTATLDGAQLYLDNKAQRVKTAIFEATIHPDYTTKNCDWRPKKAIAYADGYWLGVKLDAGTHTLVLGGKVKFDATNSFGNQVTYTIKVE